MKVYFGAAGSWLNVAHKFLTKSYCPKGISIMVTIAKNVFCKLFKAL